VVVVEVVEEQVLDQELELEQVGTELHFQVEQNYQ
jgi:hypothetical protein